MLDLIWPVVNWIISYVVEYLGICPGHHGREDQEEEQLELLKGS